MSLVEELKRRNVFRVGIAYVVVAWLVMQVADVVFDAIGSPDWVMKTLLVVLAIGLVFAIIFAWAFELTPEGIKREHEVNRETSITRTTGRKLDRVIIGVLVLALGYFAWDKFLGGDTPVTADDAATPSTPENTTPTELDESIAVLPFVNMSANAENEYFSDGLSEELLNLLAKVDGLKVAARTSSFKFKGAEADINEIGQALNVATVLEGSVRRSGNQARITAQLIKVDDGFHLWSETYDRELDNIFEVQDEIARAIVDALKLPLLGEDESAVAHQSASFEAYDLYLLGRHHLRELNADGFAKATDYFKRAVELDPQFAPAWARLGEAYMGSSDYGSLPLEDAIALATPAIDQALSLDPALAEARMAKSLLDSYRGEFVDALAVAEAVLAEDPDNIDAIHAVASLVGESDPARQVELAAAAMSVDPLSELSRDMAVRAATIEGGYDAAQALLSDWISREPDNPGLYESWVTVARWYARMDIAIEQARRVHELRDGDVMPAALLVMMHLRIEDPDGAAYWLEQARSRGPDSRWATWSARYFQEYQGEMETLVTEIGAMVGSGEALSPDHLTLYGETLIRLGRNEEARRVLSEALQKAGGRPDQPPRTGEVRSLSLLANISPEGPERQALIDRVRLGIDHFLANFSDMPFSHVHAARLAALTGDRPGLFAALDRAIELGETGATWTETDPIFAAWRDEPQFREVLARMRQNAARQRDSLAAGDAL
ncbi:hypothetical protein F3N42_08450 [Marinihelvus fidelis]|uniref:Uncharacterized protein n=1 Tax=Marinihelvus fidelis TaxID=2613842 RepID=A0A5N0T8I6_9GAMM|nr:hypothetical protein [Marinihelvus fidelis]KAA9131343.1 hypothetical protein F3N42_08450 [Marinihelvus fidelis]